MPVIRTRLEVYIDGVFTQVYSASITRGMAQEFATADIECVYPLPSTVAKWSKVIILIGGLTLFTERFVGWVLSFGESHYPGREVLHCGDEMALLKDFYPLNDVNFDGMTDEQIVTRVLVEAGIPSSHYDIQGTGKQIGGAKPTKGLHWPFIQSALEVIKEIDSFSLGYRTFCESSGMIYRRFVAEFPGDVPTRSLIGGYDILDGSTSFEEVDPKTQVNVLGDGVSTKLLDPDNKATWRSNAWWKQYKQLQIQASSMTFHSTDEVAAWIFSRLNRNLIRVSLTTFRDPLFGMLETIQLLSVPQLRVEGLKFWLQSYTVSAVQNGEFKQSLNLVSEWTFPTAVPPGSDPPMVGGPGTGIGGISTNLTTLAPSALDILPTFSIAVSDLEYIIVAGEIQTLYTVQCVDHSITRQGYITTRVWAASGTGVRNTSGVGNVFTTGFTDLDGAVVQLTITNSEGYSQTISHPIINQIGGVGNKVRVLYASDASTYYAFNGTQWNTYSPTDPPMLSLGGQLASAGKYALTTTDDLATPAVETQIFTSPDSNVTETWIEPDVSTTRMGAGSADGRIALSTNGGISWTVKAGPDGTEIRRIIISRYTPTQIHVITANGYYVSDNSGSSWTLFHAGSYTDLVLSHTRNILLRDDGNIFLAIAPFTQLTYTGDPVFTCIAPDIRDDKFYAIGDDGKTYRMTDSGAIAFSHTTDIPAGLPVAKGMWRDGSMHDVIYFATTDGLWKTTDGFLTDDGYVKLRD